MLIIFLRFGLFSNRPHSCGPLYCSINDLPHDQRYLQVNAMNISMLPGPTEPNANQLNHCIEPIVKDMSLLKKGEYFNHCVDWFLMRS